MPPSRRIKLQRARIELQRRGALIGRLNLNDGVSIQQILDEAPEDPVSVYGHGNEINIIRSPGGDLRGSEAEREQALLRDLQDQQRQLEQRLRDFSARRGSDRDGSSGRVSGPGGSTGHPLASSRDRWSAAIPPSDRDSYLDMVLGSGAPDSSSGGRREDIALAAIAFESLENVAGMVVEGVLDRRSSLGGSGLRAPNAADGLASSIASAPHTVRMVLPVFRIDGIKTTLHDETAHIRNIIIYVLEIADGDTDGDTRTFGVPFRLGERSPEGRMAVVFAKLIVFWRYQMTHPDGMYQGWMRIRLHPNFARNNGPYKKRCKADMMFLAALVCYTAGRLCYLDLVGDAAQPVRAMKSCAQLLHAPNFGAYAYDLSTVMGTNLVRFHNLANEDEKIEDVSSILDFDVHERFGLLKSRLQQNGIVSSRSDVVGNSTDLKGILLPMFLAVDTLLPDHTWRSTCQLRKVDIAEDERSSFDDNIRLFEENKH